MRSVWSREGAGSCTQVSPSAYSPASRMQLFTWALATSSRCSAPRSGAPPLTTSGGVPPGAVNTAAPMARSGPRHPRHRPSPQRVVAVEDDVLGVLAHEQARAAGA